MGASLAQQCLRAGLVDELQLTVVPVLLGAGARLFERGDQQSIELEQLEVVIASRHAPAIAGEVMLPCQCHEHVQMQEPDDGKV